jgi:Immunity protein 74
MTETFTSPAPNIVASSSGFSVQVLGRVGLCYREAGRSMYIDTEVQARPRTMALWTSSMQAWDSPNESVGLGKVERDRIVRNIARAFEANGDTLQVIDDAI